MTDFVDDRSLRADRFSAPGGSEPSVISSGWKHVHLRVSWQAILAGVVLALALQVLLSLLGAGIGANTVNVNGGTTPSASGFGIGAGIWLVLTSCIALFAGGFAAAWLAGNEIKFDGMLHGLVTWGIATLVTMYLLSSAVGSIVGGGMSAASSAASAAGSTVKDSAAPVANSLGISPDMVQQQAQAYLQPTNPNPATMSPQDAQKEVASNLVIYEQGGPDSAAAKERIIDITAAQMKISRADAAAKFNTAQAKIQQTVDQTKQKAKDAADATASGASKAAFGLFFDLLLGAVAAALGGMVAIQRRTLVRNTVVGTPRTVRT